MAPNRGPLSAFHPSKNVKAFPTARVLDALHRLYQVKDVADFPAHVMGVISDLLSASFISFDQINLSTGAALNVFDRPIPFTRAEFMARWQAHCHEHPSIAHLEAGGTSAVFAISDTSSGTSRCGTSSASSCLCPATSSASP